MGWVTTTNGRGVRYLTGDNVEVVWAEFSTVSLAVLQMTPKMPQHANGHF
jgi:hypothetical protein